MNYFAEFEIKYKAKLGKRFNTFYKALELLSCKKQPFTILETGSIREEANWVGDGCSTIIFNDFLSYFRGICISIDIDLNNSILAEKLCERVRPFNGDSVDFIYNLNKYLQFDIEIDLLYLDSFDLDKNIENISHLSALHAFKELAVSLKYLRKDSLVLIDDNLSETIQKGLYCKDLLKNIGAELVLEEYQSLWRL